MNIEPWMLPGVFLICTDGAWRPSPYLPTSPPLAGKVYTLSGAVRLPGGLVFALAEYPNKAFDAAHFQPVPHYEHMLFRRMLLNPNLLVDAHPVFIKGREH